MYHNSSPHSAALHTGRWKVEQKPTWIPLRFIQATRWFLLILLLVPIFLMADELRGSGDLGVVIERAKGSVLIVETSNHIRLAEVNGLGDLSHASVVYSRDQRYAYVFGRDGGLTKLDILQAKIVNRIVQAGNSIGGAISQDGHLIATSNYTPGGVKVFDANTLELLADIPSEFGNQQRSKVVGLVDAPGQRFVFSLFDAGEIWLADMHNPRIPQLQKFKQIGNQPYDALISPDGRYYIAGLFGEISAS